MSEPSPRPPSTTTSSAKPKPRVSLAIATAFGLGYFPKAPGTFGSLMGVALTVIYGRRLQPAKGIDVYVHDAYFAFPPSYIAILTIVLISGLGVIVASRVASFMGAKDPQIVVIDEVSGQLISYLGMGAGITNWKYLLLGFILFRVFDIWKPFPARQAESLPGGLGIMADDWVAGIYAALGLWIARAFVL